MNQYLISHRMEEAATLLESGDEPISEVASRVGYEAASAFSKAFGRYYGVSPGRYRADQKRSYVSSSTRHAAA